MYPRPCSARVCISKGMTERERSDFAGASRFGRRPISRTEIFLREELGATFVTGRRSTTVAFGKLGFDRAFALRGINHRSAKATHTKHTRARARARSHTHTHTHTHTHAQTHTHTHTHTHARTRTRTHTHTHTHLPCLRCAAAYYKRA